MLHFIICFRGFQNPVTDENNKNCQPPPTEYPLLWWNECQNTPSIFQIYRHEAESLPFLFDIGLLNLKNMSVDVKFSPQIDYDLEWHIYRLLWGTYGLKYNIYLSAAMSRPSHPYSARRRWWGWWRRAATRGCSRWRRRAWPRVRPAWRGPAQRNAPRLASPRLRAH